MKRWIAPLVPLTVTFCLLEVAVRWGWVNAFLVPAPTAVVACFWKEGPELLGAAAVTALAAVSGFALSSTLGIILAISMVSSRALQLAFYPYAVFFQTVPIVAIAPLLVIWFGYGLPSVIVCAFIVSLFPIVASTLVGLRSTDPALLDLFHLYGASGWRTLTQLRIPFALPSIFAGLRIGAGLAVIGTVVGEFIGGVGLGSVVDIARTQQRIDKVFAAVLLASGLGLILLALVDLGTFLFLRRWHPSEKK